ncbi:flagellar protein FlaG [Variovorax sp. KK3]|uniref:flagellar protein FlaG n=1 Tax=Variovorax sp. KK3 TaxID=1855728 RepID=UPI00097C3C9A|nr:flagellar protein FlaG [Variovorax sp. KK3]
MSIPVAAATDHNARWAQLVPSRTGAAIAAEEVNAPADAVEAATPVQVERAVSEVNATLQMRSVGLRFEVDQDIDKVIVKVVDRDSGELIRQIPTEEALRIAKVLGRTPGLLMDQSA